MSLPAVKHLPILTCQPNYSTGPVSVSEVVEPGLGVEAAALEGVGVGGGAGVDGLLEFVVGVAEVIVEPFLDHDPGSVGDGGHVGARVLVGPEPARAQGVGPGALELADLVDVDRVVDVGDLA